MKDILQFLNENTSAVLGIMAILGISIEVAPIKINPITWFMKKINKPIYDKFNDLDSRLDNIECKVDENTRKVYEFRANEIKTKLFEFASAVERGVCFPKDNYLDMFNLHDDYLHILFILNKTNGATDICMQTIKRGYEHCLHTCQFKKLKDVCDDPLK